MPMMSDSKVLLLNRHVSLIPLRPETTGLSITMAKLQRSLLMDVDLPLGTEQALMLHFCFH